MMEGTEVMMIKTCPFCGSLALVESKEQSTKVRCMDDNCGVSLTRFRFDGSHHASAVIAWNRRASLRETE